MLRTDHVALKWLMQFRNSEGQIARLIKRLQEYDFMTSRLNTESEEVTITPTPCLESPVQMTADTALK